MCGINILIAAKSIKKIYKGVEFKPMTLKRKPESCRDVIELCVEKTIELYLNRNKAERPLGDDEYEFMAEIGKFSFTALGNKEVNVEKAINTAIEAFSDGLFKLLHNNIMLTALDQCVDANENDCFTFIRLTMLTGRMY